MAAAGASLQRGGSSNGNGSRSSSSSSACTRVAPVVGNVVAVSPAHSLDYDCTDCGSFLFGHRGRARPASRPQGHHGTRSNGHHNSHRNSLSEPAQVSPWAHAQRLLAVNSTPFAPAVPSTLPQNEQLSSSSSSSAAGEAGDSAVAYVNGVGLHDSNEASESVSLQEEEEEEDGDAEEGANSAATVMDFVACHGATNAAGRGGSDSASTLAEIFRCFICLGKVVDAQLCPCCSKLVCQPCIKRWLTDQKSECPHCRAPLLVSQLVSCRFISEISLEVEKIQGKLGDSPIDKYCPAHDSPLLYFCTTCSVAVCSDCAVLIEDHRNHTFEKLSVAYGRHKKKIRMEAAGLRKRRKELSALVTSVDKNIETVLKSKDESAAELQIAFKRMQSRLEQQLKCKLLALLAQKGSMTQEMELLDTILHELDQQLNSIPKSDLIAQEPNMSRMLQDIRTRTFSEISRTPIPPEFTSEVVPSYEYGELIFKSYKENLSETGPATDFTPGGDPNTSEVLSSKDVVYSEPMSASGVTWRLKVYPNGSGASEGTHLSVFLEMVEGGHEAATYEYGIELLHRSRPHQRIVRKFSSDFEAGACWGYYQFFRLDLLEKEGYLQAEEDTIALRFYVRPLTYQQQCQDLRRSLETVRVERDESATQVAVIRRAFAATFFQRRRRRSSRATLPIQNDQQVLSFMQARVSSPSLAVRKPSHTKHVPTKPQDCTGTKPNPNPNPNKWTLPGIFPQAEEELDHPHPSIPTCLPKPSPTENPFAEFPAPDDGAPSAEHLDPKRPSHRELWIKKTDDIFQIPKSRSQSSKKLRSRKAHKLLLAPETLLLPSFSRQLASLSVVEAGPSSRKLVHEGASDAPALGSSSDGGDGDDNSPREKCDQGGSYFDEESGNATVTPTVNVVEMSGVLEESNKFPYYSSLSGCSNNFISPEIEDWGNLK